VKNLSNHKLKDISFDVHEGEIVGFYGLVGAGKTELARAIYGIDDYEGEITFKGRKLPPSPDKAIEAGIALVPEERRSQGLFTILTIRGNVPVMNMKKISRNGFINAAQERKVTREYIDTLRIATSSTEKEASKLSGGNQQKVVFAKCLFADAGLLMLDEPTRGIDVGAKSEIYGIIRRLSAEGKSIMIFSSELPEIMNICDTIYLLYDGSLKATMRNGCDVDSEKIIHIVTGGDVASGNRPNATDDRGGGD
jgi:ribose transport system ATP-binding protein